VPTLLGTAGVPVVLIGPPAQLDGATLRDLHLTALVTTPPDGRTALGLARGAGCPLVASTVAAGQTAAALEASRVPLGVVVAQVASGVTVALDASAVGSDYHDPLLDTVSPDAAATQPARSARTWQLLALGAHGLAPAAIADELAIHRASVY